MEVKIRAMENRDVNAVYAMAIKAKELGTWYPKIALNEWLKKKNDDILLVAEYNRKVVGFCLSYVHFKKWVLWDSIVVDKKYRRKAIATKLMEETMRISKKMGIVYMQAMIMADNGKSLKFASKLGMGNSGNKFYVVDRVFEENFNR